MLATGAYLGAYVGAFGGGLPSLPSGTGSLYAGQFLAEFVSGYLGASATVGPPPPDPGPGPAPDVVLVGVPSVIGRTALVAIDRLRSAGFVPFVNPGAGTVTAQDPPPFVLRLRGSSVTVTLGGIIRGAKSTRSKGLPVYQTPEGYQ